MREALDTLEPYCRPEWRIQGFRENLKRDQEIGSSGEGQQQVLRVYFGGIYESVRKLLSAQIAKLVDRHRKTNDSAVKVEIDRLTIELAALHETWLFVDR